MASDIEKNLDKFISVTLDKAINKGLELVGQTIENTAKRNCPVSAGGGVLKAKLTHEVDTVVKEVVIGSGEEYAPYVHEGTGIYAKNSKAKKIPWTYRTADGKFHTTSGQEPNPFLQNAIDENRGLILKTLGEGAKTEWKI